MRAFPLLMAAVLLAGCEEDEPVDTYEPVEELPVPDLAGMDLDAAFAEALQQAAGTDLRKAWAAHSASIDKMQPGCPNFYAGMPDLADMNNRMDDAPGVSWSDTCTLAGGRSFGGWLYWETDIEAQGDPEAPAGRSIDATRTLNGDGSIAEGDEVWFEFDGEGSDSVSLSESPGYTAWTYSSLVQGTMSGAGIDGGHDLRTDLALAYTGGDTSTIEARGNIYWFSHRISDRFDSVRMDLRFSSPESTAPDACALEPAGYISLRDENAYWYELVFEPRYEGDATGEDYENDPYIGCDGCGTLYVRGLEQDIEVCPNLDFLWQEGTLTPPSVEDFVLSIRTAAEEEAP